MEKDKSYFMRRAAQERSAAERSADHAARDAHEELERRYRELIGPEAPNASEPEPAAVKPVS